MTSRCDDIREQDSVTKRSTAHPMKEVNSYYTEVKPSLPNFSPDVVSASSALRAESVFSRLILKIYAAGVVLRRTIPWLFIAVLIFVAAVEIFFLHLVIWFRRKRKAEESIYSRAREFIPELSKQYPFGGHPILWKSIQLALLRGYVAPFRKSIIVEAAIGEESLSSRVFDKDFSVIGLDINPVSLQKVIGRPHISQAIVCDCMNPPLNKNSIDILVSNNFIHHVTDKEGVIRNWARAAAYVYFNECSQSWSEALLPSYFLHGIGFHDLARRIAQTVNLLGAQCLLPRNELDALFSREVQVEEVHAFISQFTYCMATIPSLVCLQMGPTPFEIRQALAGSLVEGLVDRLTKRLSELLLYLDQTSMRSADDVLIHYFCKSKSAKKRRSGGVIRCACGSEQGLSSEGICPACGRAYPKIDGMLFVLPEHLSTILDNYDGESAAAFPKEHL